jgi:hypothetical protein
VSFFTAIAYLVVGNLAIFLIVGGLRFAKYAWIGRRLVDAAGNDNLAELAILDAARERGEREKALAEATDKAFRRGLKNAVALRLVQR